MGLRCPEGCIADPRNASLVETSWEYRRMVAPLRGRRGPEGAVTSYMDERYACRCPETAHSVLLLPEGKIGFDLLKCCVFGTLVLRKAGGSIPDLLLWWTTTAF
jgi:hypothetical protein